MKYIDYVTFDQAFLKSEPGTIRRDVFKRAVQKVYGKWIPAVQEGKVSSETFHSYYVSALEELGIDNPLVAERYRKALGAYFSERSRLKREALKQRRKAIPPVPKNKVDRASGSRVVVRVVPEISLHFEALKPEGRLKLTDVRKIGRSTHCEGGSFTDKQKHKARVQALATMNNIRFKTQNSKSGT